MINIDKSITITGSSIIKTDKEEFLVAYMNANISSDGNINISKTIANTEMFNLYKTQVLKDCNEFEQYVYNSIKQ